MASGLDKITQALSKQKGNLLWIIPTLAMAETKLQGIAEVVKAIAIWKMIGPLGLVLSAFTGISSTVRTLLRDTGSLEAVLRRLSSIRMLEGQFRAMGNSVEQVRRKVAELISITENLKLFKLEDVGSAARSLEILTRGAYSGRAALETMADSAVATGNSLQDTAGAVGDFYADLREGKPVSAAAAHLRSMGLISAETADRLDRLQKSGAAFDTVVGTLDAELQRNAGSVERQKQSIEGLTTAYDEARTALQRKFGAPFAEGELDAMRNATKVLQALGPVAEQVAGYLGSLISPVEKVTAKVTAWAVGLKGVPEILAITGKSVVTLGAGLLALGGYFGLKALAVFLSSMLRVAATSGAATVATASFGSALASARVAGAALTQGNIALATSQGLVAARSFASAVAVKAFSLAMRAIPILAVIAAITTVINVFQAWRDANEQASKSIEETRNSTRDMVDGLRAQEAAMSTLEDKVRTLASANEALTAAYREYYEEANKPVNRFEKRHQEEVIAEKRKKIDEAQSMVTSIESRTELAPTDAERAISRQRMEREQRMREIVFQGRMERASPEGQQELRAEKIRELEVKAALGRAGIQGRADTERRRMEGEGRVMAAKTAVDGATAFQRAVETNENATDSDRLRAAGSLAKAQRNLNSVRAQQEALGLDSGSKSIGYETRANMMQAGRDAEVARMRLNAMQGRGDDAVAISAQSNEVDRLEKLSGGRRGTPAMIARLRDLAGQARALEESAEENSSRAAEMSQAQRSAQIEIDSAARRLAVEREIAGLKSVGAERSAEEWAIRKAALEAEKAVELARGGDDNILAGLNNQIAEGDRAAAEARRQATVTEEGVRREIAMGAADRSGASSEATALADLDQFASTFESLRAALGESKALDLAQKLTQNSIAQSVFEADKSGVVDSLQRIGGGGGIGSDPMLSLAERQAKLQERMAGYLQTIASASSTAITPAPYAFSDVE